MWLLLKICKKEHVDVVMPFMSAELLPLFDFEKSEFSLCEDVKLEKPTCFPSKFFLFQGEFAYQFDNDGDIHEFNIKECSFKIVSQHRGDY